MIGPEALSLQGPEGPEAYNNGARGPIIVTSIRGLRAPNS